MYIVLAHINNVIIFTYGIFFRKSKQLTNPIQKKMLIDFMEKHPEFAKGLLNNAQGRSKKSKAEVKP